jgi:hypothetical protein
MQTLGTLADTTACEIEELVEEIRMSIVKTRHMQEIVHMQEGKNEREE